MFLTLQDFCFAHIHTLVFMVVPLVNVECFCTIWPPEGALVPQIQFTSTLLFQHFFSQSPSSLKITHSVQPSLFLSISLSLSLSLSLSIALLFVLMFFALFTILCLPPSSPSFSLFPVFSS